MFFTTPLTPLKKGARGNGTDIRKKCFQKPPEGDINKNKTITTTSGG
jgi:hypothetical protein